MSTWDKVRAALEPYGIKSTGANRWRCNDPFRAGSDSQAISILVHEDGEHGTFYDWKDAESGSLYELAEQLGIELPRATEVQTTKRKYESAADYAKSHGVDWQVFADAGWVYEDHDGRPSLKVPVGPPDKRTYRFRFLDGEKPHWKSEAGFTPCWYGLRRAVTMARDAKLPLFIVNGEPSVVAAQHFGIPAVAGAGMGERANGLPSEMLKELREAWAGPYAVIPDCDDTGKAYSKSLSVQLSDLLVIDLGLTKGGDVCDFCMLYAPTPLAALKRKLDHAPAADGSLSMARVVSLARADATKWRADPRRIRGLRLGFARIDDQYGGLMPDDLLILMAASNVGKSTVVTQMSVSLAAQAEGGFVSSEMYPWWGVQRMTAMRARVEIRRVWDGALTHEEWDRYFKAFDELSALNIHWYNKKTPEPNDLIEFAKMHPSMRWIIVDSMNNIGALGKAGDVYNNLRDTLVAFDTLRGMGICVLATLQDKPMSGPSQPNEEPNPYNAYGGSSPYQFATRFLTMWRPGFHAKGADLNRTLIRSWKDRYFGATNAKWPYTYTGYCLVPEDIEQESNKASILLPAGVVVSNAVVSNPSLQPQAARSSLQGKPLQGKNGSGAAKPSWSEIADEAYFAKHPEEERDATTPPV